MEKIIVINFKNYVYGSKLLDIIRKVDIYCNKAVVAVPFPDIRDIAKNTTLPVYAQHVEHIGQGRGTGFVTLESLKDAGAIGSIINHSEHPVSFRAMKLTIARAKELDMRIIVCVKDLKEAEKVKKLNPYAIAFEDEKLVATGKAITAYRTNDIKKFVEMMKGTGILALCGAGISSAVDLRKALELGCAGIIVSSAIANSQEPDKFLKEASKLL